MPDSPCNLEERRSQIVLAIAQLDDFHSDSIDPTLRRFGKPSCA